MFLKVGYGYDERLGIVVGRNHDNGIDGIIDEDLHWLSLVCLQAESYTPRNIIGRLKI